VEAALVERAKTDTGAFSELYDIYFPKIYRYVSWRVGSARDTEDIVSVIFTKVVKKITSFHPQSGATFSSWIYRIAYNTIADHYRTSKKRAYVSIDQLPEIVAETAHPDDTFDQKELFQKVRKVIKTLPERQSEIITLRYLSGMRNKEIAEILGIKEKSVASTLCRALKSLHNKVKKQ